MPKTKRRKMSPAQRVAEAFDPDALARICVMDEEDFAAAFDLATYATPTPLGGFYAHGDRGADVLAVAHLDTVAVRSTRRARFTDSQAGPVVFSRALDDRLGAYVILDLLPKLGITTDILLTVGEERGESTAQHYEPDREYDWMIEFDRGGTDVVMYQYEDQYLSLLVEAAGARVGDGSFSDIAFMEHLGCKGFNWGVGYREYHTARAHAFLNDTFEMVGQFLTFHEQNEGIYLPHEPYVGGSPWSDLLDPEPEPDDPWPVISEDDIRAGLYQIASERLG